MACWVSVKLSERRGRGASMRMKRLLVFTMIIGMVLANGSAAGEVLYGLLPGTTFQKGCISPCLCPISISEEVTGTFLLIPEGPDPLFINYR